MSKSGYRKITVEGKEYLWKAGKAFVKIKGFEAVPNNEDNPFPFTSWADGVTPAAVAKYIAIIAVCPASGSGN